mmetsp:Transcript_16174/g.48251  ORF Transcript_16174/g.48251 Transcript_16174/m.48251 type:complete len:309 (+) Transcript_16174:177-1103(+)
MKFDKPSAARLMRGTLFQYSARHNLQAFLSGPVPPMGVAIVLGGLSDGLLACPYAPMLAETLGRDKWAVAQPVLRSSYQQFGFGSLDQDCEDLDELVSCLDADDDLNQFVIIGHSTGSQVAAHYARTRDDKRLVAIVLQAGVSDRETDDTAALARRAPVLERARKMVSEGKGEEFLPRSAFWAPMTAQRFLDLHAVGGADDYFSSDLDDAALKARFPRIPDCLVAYSGADEYAAPSVDKRRLVERLCCAMTAKGRVAGIVVPNADHALSKDEQAAPAFVQAVADFLKGDRLNAEAVDVVYDTNEENVD